MKSTQPHHTSVDVPAIDDDSPWTALLLQPTHSAMVHAVDEQDTNAVCPEASGVVRLAVEPHAARVMVEAEQALVLRCGEASITLTRDGKVFIRGTYVESHATGVQRIKGGCVRIN